MRYKKRKINAPYFQLEKLRDGTNAIRCTTTTNTYLSVKEEIVNGMNVIKADATTIGDNEKFILKGTGASFYYLQSPTFDNRIVYVDVVNENNPALATLTLRLGHRVSENANEVINNERFILMYNTRDVALKDITLANTDNLEKLINDLPTIDQKDYTVESYKNYIETLTLAKQYIKDAQDGRIFQEKIDLIYNDLLSAYQLLKKVKNNIDISIEQNIPEIMETPLSNQELPLGSHIVNSGDNQNNIIYLLSGLIGLGAIIISLRKKSLN